MTQWTQVALGPNTRRKLEPLVLLAEMLNGTQSANTWRMLGLITRYVDSDERERFRRCSVCQTWFVDRTRNKSARRCSRACTIRWSNSRRPLVDTVRGGRHVP